MKILFILLLLSHSLFAVHSSLDITLSNNSTSKKITITAGIDSLATDVWDKHLGEESYPTMFPPGTFMGYFETIDSSQVDSQGHKIMDYIWLDKDYRPYNKNEKYFKKRYMAVFNWGLGTKITINWDKNLHYAIDSAFIMDAFEGVVFKHNMKNVSSFEITNDGIRKFFVDVYYRNLDLVSVDSEFENEIIISPNPTSDYIILNNDGNIKYIKIYNYMGTELNNYILNNNIIDVTLFDNGCYFVILNDIADKTYYFKFIVKK